jgi:hypothetical protein
MTVTAVATGQTIEVRVTGVAATTIAWEASVDMEKFF